MLPTVALCRGQLQLGQLHAGVGETDVSWAEVMDSHGYVVECLPFAVFATLCPIDQVLQVFVLHSSILLRT